jgi:hypothetical protein
MKFRKVKVVLHDERSGKVLELHATPFSLDGGCIEPRSGVFLDAIVHYAGMKFKQSATITKPYSFDGPQDAEATAKLVIADFLRCLASLERSMRVPPEWDHDAEWRIYVQAKASHLYTAAQEKRFPLDVLEVAAEFGQFCGLCRFVYLYFCSTNAYYADRLRTAIEQFENDGSRLFTAAL